MKKKNERHPNQKPLFVSFLLDETGSMQSIKDDTIGGFNEYIDELKKGPEETLFSLVSFNSSHTKKRYVAEPISKVRHLTDRTYQPEAMTPLIDAAVKIINATQEAVDRRNDEVDVVIVMQTDGHENVSVEYANADLALLVKEKQAAGWQFLFLGAGMDAFAAAQDAGIMIDAQRVMSYGRGRSKEAFGVMARKMAAYGLARELRELDFTDEEREEAGDEFHSGRSGTSRTSGTAPKEGGRKRKSSVDDIGL